MSATSFLDMLALPAFFDNYHLPTRLKSQMFEILDRFWNHHCHAIDRHAHFLAALGGLTPQIGQV